MGYQNHQSQTPLRKTCTLFKFLNDSLGPEVRDRIGIVRSEWSKILKGKDLPHHRFEEILQKVGLNSLTTINSKIDHHLALDYLLGVRDQVPFQFTRSAYSTRRIGRIIFKILEEQFGETLVKNIMFALQIGPEFFSVSNDLLTVNTELYGEIYKLLSHYFGFSTSDLYWLGQKTAYYNENTLFAKKFNFRNLINDYAFFLEEVANNIEKSYHYDLVTLNKKKVIIKKKLSLQMQDELGKKIYGNKETCAYSLGFTTTVGHFSCSQFPKATMLKNLYDGHDCSLYEINLTQFKQPKLFYHSNLVH